MTQKCLITVAKGEPSDRIPVWFFRQAGRTLPEYRELRARTGTFLDLCQNPRLAAEVTLQPIRRYDIDGAIIFSDILVPCVAMGQKLAFDKGHGPVLTSPVRSMADVQKLRLPDAHKDLGYVGEALDLVKTELKPHQTLIGFAGAPLTVASYMIEGGSSRDHAEVRKFRYHDPEGFKALFSLLAQVTADYLSMQVDAGAECLVLFDSWAHHFDPEDVREFEIPAVNQIINAVKEKYDVPIVYYPGESLALYQELAPLKKLDVVAVNWRIRLEQALAAFQQIGANYVVQGNIDPQFLLAEENMIRERTRKILLAGQKARGHIFNVGHGLQPHIPIDAIHTVIKEVRRFEAERR
jgi:uroporphyrinogen decarboxylase